MTIRLVDDWKKVWTYSSAQLAVFGAAISAAGPALDAWYVVPDTLKKMMPGTLATAMPLVIVFAAIFMARHVTTTPATTTVTDATETK